ncbi:hypothetical protein AAG895_12970 [Thauera sp. JM12B12]|uniref:hypothetical protein n=1 Tax=Thauera sp. JM12B12 TaxID=3142262 RepID=UPI0031F33DC3
MKKKHLLATIAWAFAGSAAFASPADDVMAPDIEKGEREFEVAYGTDRSDAGKYESALALSFGAGISERWATELGVEFERARGEHMKYGGIEWENRLGLIIDEDAPVALSLLVGFERPRERAEGWSSTLGLLSETTVGRFLVNANLLVERNWDVDAEDEGDEGEEEDEDHDPGAADRADDDAEARTTLGYQWQVLYRHSHRIYYGVQGMGEMGQWDDWAERDEQEHRIGPALFGRIKHAGGQRLNYTAGLLFGVTDATPDYTLRLKLEYEL